MNKIDELKNSIMSQIAEYYRLAHRDDGVFDATHSRINYAGRIFDENELLNLTDAALEFWLTAGKWTKQFESGLADFLGIKHVLLVNSGSSANLLAFMALTSPLLGERTIKRGDEVITVAAGFPTTVAPIIQYGAVPVFVDVDLNGNIRPDLLNAALSVKTKAVFAAHTLGNPFALKEVKDFCRHHNLWLIEDNCDALGAQYQNCYTGTFGDVGTSSFYPPHHMTMGEGGAVYTDNPTLKKILLSM
ncbi:MAG: aminotransferase class V-fold PLP-dependent enzyme, partial [Victivallaceae bacterium]